eukprot:627557-Rhodomonas_salina.1
MTGTPRRAQWCAPVQTQQYSPAGRRSHSEGDHRRDIAALSIVVAHIITMARPVAAAALSNNDLRNLVSACKGNGWASGAPGD